MKNSIKSDDRELGLLFEPEKQSRYRQLRAYVRRWRDVLDENKRRLEFVTSSLEHDPSVSDGLAYPREHYGDLLPPAEEVASRSGLLVTRTLGAHLLYRAPGRVCPHLDARPMKRS